MKNVYKPLSKSEMESLRRLNNPLVKLMFILGWRRSEISQLILQGSPSIMAPNFEIRFKHNKEKEAKNLNGSEWKILRRISEQYDTFRAWQLRYENGENERRCINGLSRQINLVFEKLSKGLGFKLTPHRLRATHATVLARMGVTPLQIQASLHHQNLSTTDKYVQLTDDDVVENRQLLFELNSFEGMTFAELKNRYLDQRKYIKRLENKINEVRAKYQECKDAFNMSSQ